MSEKKGSVSTKKSPHIVILGNPGSGKTTLLASICHYINNQEEFVLRYNLSDKKGIHYLNEIWQNSLVKGEFPPHENQLENVAVDLSIVAASENVKHNFTFLELPDETISVFSNKDKTYENYLQFIEYLDKADLAILVVDVEEAHGNDLSVDVFFQTLQTRGITLPILLVISKWDWSPMEDVTKFVKSGMPATYKWLKSGYFPGAMIFKFSVGEVDYIYSRDHHAIRSLNDSDSGEIFNWIFDYFKKQMLTTNVVEQKLKLLLSQLSKEPENFALLRDIKNIYVDLGENEEAAGVERKLNRLMEKKESEFNLGKRIILQQVELHDLYFFGNFIWTFQPGINVLLGRNGYGKSHLLRLLAALLQKNDDISSEFFKHSKENPFAKILLERDDKGEVILRSKVLFEKSIGKVPVIAVPSNRILDKSRRNVTLLLGEDNRDLQTNSAYHFLYQKSVEDLILGFYYQLCIAYLNEGKRFDIPIFNLIHKVLGELSDDEFRFCKIEPINGVQFKVDVITEGNDKPLPVQQASHGTLSVMAVFGLIYEYLKAVFPKVPLKELTHQSAIVFIDELDAHLHPAWQQKIIPLLRENFPNVQFFVTAHSPLVVAGCREGEVAVLRKQENGFGVHVFEHDFIGYEAKELYEKVFEIEEKDETYLKHIAISPFKKEIEEKIKKLEEKQKKKPLSEKVKKELDQLYDEIHYIDKSEDKFQQRMECSMLRIENRKLKSKLKKLEEQRKPEGHDINRSITRKTG